MRQSLFSFSRLPLQASALAVAWGLAFTLVCTARSSVVVRPDPVELGIKPGAEGAMTLLFENVQESVRLGDSSEL